MATIPIILTKEDLEADMEKIMAIGKIWQVRTVLLLILRRGGGGVYLPISQLKNGQDRKIKTTIPRKGEIQRGVETIIRYNEHQRI